MSKYLLSLTRRPVASLSEAAGVPSLSRGIRVPAASLGLEAPRGTAASFPGWLRRLWYQPLSTHEGAGDPASPKQHSSRAPRAGLRVAGLLAVLCLLVVAALAWRKGFALHASAGASTRSYPWATSSSEEAALLPESAEEAVANKKGPLDPKAGVVDASMMVAFEGGAAAANAVLAAERAVFARPPFRRPLEDKTQPEDGYYLFGWTIPEIAFRIALPDTSRHLPHVVMDRPQRVGGVMRRLGVLALASARHTLAIVQGGQLYSWGADWDSRGRPAGLLGRKGPFWRPALVDVFRATPGANPEPIVAVAAGRTHSVAVTKSGKVFTWGLNSHGQLGRETSSKEAGFVPGQVTGAGLERTKVVSVAASAFYTLVVTEKGDVVVWGACYLEGPAPFRVEDEATLTGPERDEWAAAARRAAEPRRVSEAVMGSGETDKVAAGAEHWVALSRNGQVFTASTGFTPEGVRPPSHTDYTWLGHPKKGEGTPSHIPQQVKGLLSDPNSVPTGIAAGRRITFATTSNLKLVSWGEAEHPALGRSTRRMHAHFPAYVGNPEGGTNSLFARTVTEVAAAEDYALALTADGFLYSWGGNRYGQLGRPGLLTESEPGMVSQLALSSPLEPAGMVAGTHQAFALCSLRGEGAQKREVAPDPFAPGAGVLEEAEPGTAWWGGQAELSDEELSSAWGVPLAAEGGAPDAFPMVWEEAHREDILGLTRDMLPLLPRKGFERRFRNPCWHANATQGAPGAGPGKLLCLPFFLCAGVPRAGTEDLYRRLTTSGIPEVAAASQPAPHWWDERTQDLAWYADLFGAAAAQAERSVDTITGEASDRLLTHSGLLVRGQRNHTVMLPELVFAILPTVQIIVVLRNPVDRFFADFMTRPDTRYPKDAAGFKLLVDTVLPKMEECLRKEDVRTCSRRLYPSMPGLCQSMYATFIKDWMRLFDRNLFFFLKFEDYAADTREAVTRVLKFLDLETDFGDEVWGRIQEGQPVQDGPGPLPLGPEGGEVRMDPVTRGRLEDFYGPLNEELMHLVGDKRFSWLPDR